jgi:predicted acylesterase/phospholipase RssA
VLFEGRALIDGWVVNPLPTDVLRREGIERVIAVDASAGIDPTAHPQGEGGEPAAGGLRGLRRRLANPAIIRVAMRAMEMGGRERSLANLALADACVQPDVTKFSALDARLLEEIVAIGESAAEAALPAVIAALGKPTGPRLETVS